MTSSPMNFTTRPPSACTTPLTVASNSLSSIDNSAGVRSCVSAVNPDRSAKPTPHTTFADVSRRTPSKWVRALLR